MNQTNDENFGGIQYLKENEHVTLPYLILYLLGVLIDITGKK